MKFKKLQIISIISALVSQTLPLTSYSMFFIGTNNMLLNFIMSSTVILTFWISLIAIPIALITFLLIFYLYLRRKLKLDKLFLINLLLVIALILPSAMLVGYWTS